MRSVRHILSVTLAAALTLQALPAPRVWATDVILQAGSSPKEPPSSPAGGQPPSNFPSHDEPTAKVDGDPIDFSRGDFILTRQDAFLPGRGLSVDLTFTYRSRSGYNGAFGYGWDMHYNRRVRKLDNGNVIVLRGTNQKDEFVSQGGVLVPPAGVYDTLVQQADGTCTMTSKHGDKEFYDVNGNLTRLEDRNGNALMFTYDPAGLLPITGRSAYFVNQVTGIIAREYRLTQITDTAGRTVDFAYTPEGRLASTSYAGRTISYQYSPDGTGDLLSVTTPVTPDLPSGATTAYAYTNHNLESITDPKGQVYLSNVYNANDQVIQQTYGTGTTTVSYTPPRVCPSTPGSGDPGFALSLMPSVIEAGQAFTVTWSAPAAREAFPLDGIGLVRVGDPDEALHAYLQLHGNVEGTLPLTTQIVASDGFYEARYLLESQPSAIAGRSNTACVGTSFLVPALVTADVTDRRGFRTLYTFDEAGHVTRLEQFTAGLRPGDPVSYVTTYEYNANGERIRAVYPRGNSVEFEYDAKGNILEVRRKAVGMPAGVDDSTDLVTRFTYEPQFTFPKTVTDPRGNVTTYMYDYELGEPAKGNLRRMTYPTVSGVTPQVEYTYTTAGQLDAATDATGLVVKHAYDPVTGYLIQRTDGFGTTQASSVQFTYDAVGNLTAVTDALGRTTDFNYNLLNQLIQTTAPAPFNFQTHYRYDANGNMIHMDRQATPGLMPRPAPGTVSAVDGWQSTLYTYDALDRMATVTDDVGRVTSFAYDPNGNFTAVTDAKLQTTTHLYDERDLLWKSVDPLSPVGVVERQYDANGNLARLLDEKANATNYSYDDFDRLVRTIDAAGAFEQYAYDKASNLTTFTNARGQVVTYTYDALNRLTQRTMPGENFTYGYDAAGRLLTAGNLANMITHTYDVRKRLASVTQPTGKTVTYTYDATGLRTTLAYPSGPTVSYTYDELNRLSTINDLNGQAINFAYDVLSRRTNVNLPNGVTSIVTYDAADQLTSLVTEQAATLLSSFTYDYDPVGNRTSITDPQGAHAYTYDSKSQLLSASNPTTVWDYDPAGNRTSATGATYLTNALNQYTHVNTVNYSYDFDGNLTNDGATSYTYDALNRLTQVVRGGTTVSYLYDALGRRASRTVNGTITRFVYDGDDLLCELNNLGTITARYLYGSRIDEPIEVQRGGTTLYYTADGLGSTAHLTDAAGVLVESYSYDPYGTPTIRNGNGTVISNSAVQNSFLFTGREWEPELGLYYYRARYYHSVLGRFLQRDTLGPVDGPNVYSYVGNNPLVFIDPEGTSAIGIIAKTVKGGIKLIKRQHAIKILQRKGSVTIRGSGSSQQARQIAREAWGKKVIRHDAHQTGWKPHYKPKSGRGHANYTIPGSAAGVFLFGDNVFGHTIDFFNPMADIQTLIELARELEALQLGESEAQQWEAHGDLEIPQVKK